MGVELFHQAKTAKEEIRMQFNMSFIGENIRLE